MLSCSTLFNTDSIFMHCILFVSLYPAKLPTHTVHCEKAPLVKVTAIGLNDLNQIMKCGFNYTACCSSPFYDNFDGCSVTIGEDVVSVFTLCGLVPWHVGKIMNPPMTDA